ncbi:DNA sulfur modification protein DndB [Planococcus halocryophilus]|uniref:DNA sulfur modification protein DndB n=1 Tax=Planococcus halocryophilus TaxID=1215089 RepID=UPI001F10F807|nr:DNA sulfur modification protein DndB [Planococcus halocryophilus]MCH4825551.1 DGQHR domain-containing protein [Planococcus halocryophilus]
MTLNLSSLSSEVKKSYITMSGIKREQFNQEVITIQCTVNDILKFLEVDLKVQRELDENKVASIGQYIQYGLDGNDIYFSPLIFSARGQGVFDEGRQAYSLSMDERLIILDGQHRIRAFEFLKRRMEVSNGNEELYHMLLNFPMTIQIFMDLELEQERQLFTDINTKSSVVNNTLLIMYKKDDMYGELVREVVNNLPIDLIECRAKSTRTKLMTASTLYAVAKALNDGVFSRNSKSAITKDNYEEYKKKTEDFVTLFRQYAPIDAGNRDKYIIMSSNIIVAIAKFIYTVQTKHPYEKMEDLFKDVIAKVDWTHRNEEFKKLSAKYNRKTKKYNFGSTGRTIRDFSEFLTKKYEEVRS